MGTLKDKLLGKAKDKDRLCEWQDKFETALMAYGKERDSFEKYRDQYDGSRTIDGGVDASFNWNITKELIESQIDSTIPPCKVTPVKPGEKYKRRARIIEAALRTITDRLPMEYFNDEDERTTKIMGGGAYMTEWDTTKQDSDGEIALRLINPTELVPQEGIAFLHQMEYFFLMFSETKERIKKRYNKDVGTESVDTRFDTQDMASDLVTQIVCYYKNDKGRVGCMSWVGDTVLIDDDDFMARKFQVCASCGAPRRDDEKVCEKCGGEKWRKATTDESLYETVFEDIKTPAGGVIPAQSIEMKNGLPVMEERDEQVTNNGMPLYSRQFDPRGNMIAEEPVTRRIEVPKAIQTRLPRYYPKGFPIAIRKNVSVNGKFLGDSDCAAVREEQMAINKILSKCNKKVLGSGSYLTKPDSLNITLSDEDLVPISIESVDQLPMLQAIEMKFNIAQDVSLAEGYYYKAKGILGITDTFQGKADTTATSGRAKEVQVSQAAGRQRSKQVMKSAAYSEMYRTMFEFLLAYSDEEIRFNMTSDTGDAEECIFSRYDFLDMDENGEWSYDDEYLFNVDESGLMFQNRDYMLEDLRVDFSAGAYGDPSNPETLVQYWTEKKALGYPNAGRMVLYFQQKAQEQQMLAQQQMMMEQQAMQQQAAQEDGTVTLPDGSAVPAEQLDAELSQFSPEQQAAILQELKGSGAA